MKALSWIFLSACVIALFAIVHTSHAEVRPATGPHPPVVVELFTSEGCSSCPPADRLLSELQKQSRPEAQIVVLSEHVDYWNYIGWKDPFSSKQYSDRQTAYAQALGSDEVYTPQMVVDGTAVFTGSDRSRAASEIAKAASTPKRTLTVAARQLPGSMVETSVQDPQIADGDVLVFAITEDNLETLVKRGENSGRALSHTGVVRALKEIRPGNRQNGVLKATFDLRSEWRKSNLTVVVFQQDRKKKIVAAGAIKPELLLN